MITLDDIEDMSALTRAEIEALAEHEHINTFDATLMGDYMMHVHHGPQRVHEMICDDIRSALHDGNRDRAAALFAVLREFLDEHPEAARNVT